MHYTIQLQIKGRGYTLGHSEPKALVSRVQENQTQVSNKNAANVYYQYILGYIA